MLLLGLVGGCASVIRGRAACTRSADLVPSCGVLWGVATNPNTAVQLHKVEQEQGRPFDMVYRFHDLDDTIPTDDERTLVRDGRVLHITIDSRIYQPPAQPVRWADVASGAYDSTLTAQAHGIASLRVPVFITFDHEPDQEQRPSSGSPGDFIEAWRHVHDVFRRAGAANAVWVWVVTGYAAYIPTAAQMWPGNQYVDWISWEAYNSSGCRSGAPDPASFRSFAQTALPFYQWIKLNGAAHGIDTDKPMMISESASAVYSRDPNLTASWYRQIPDVLGAHPQIRAIGLWDKPGTNDCPFQFDAESAVRAAISQAGMQAVIRGR
jgi:hypothetical protein